MLLGIWFRISAVVFALCFTYFFLLEKAIYLNHFYFVCLLAWLLACTNADAKWSLPMGQRSRSGTVPMWQIGILRFQLIVVYFYGGLAKLNSDWLAGEPIRHWLRARASWDTVGPLFTQEWFVYFICYGGLLFDLLIGFVLLSRKFRWFSFPVLVFFHLSNMYFFSIGIFPYLAIGSTLLFLDPDHPSRLAAWLGRKFGRRPASDKKKPKASAGVPAAEIRKSTLFCLTAYCLFQLLFPFRHWLYPGNVAWTEEGHRYSWRMMLRTKAGHMALIIRNPATGQTARVTRFPKLTRRQQKKMKARPDMIVQYVHFVRDQFRREGYDPEIYVDAWVSLNGRAYKRLVDPERDLAKVEYSPVAASEWIMPLAADLEFGLYPRFRWDAARRSSAPKRPEILNNSADVR